MSLVNSVVEADGKLFLDVDAAVKYLDKEIANTDDPIEIGLLNAERESALSDCPRTPRQGSAPRPSDYPLSVLVEVALFDDKENAHLPNDFEATLEYVLSSSLSPLEKQTFDCRFKEGLTYKEIGERLNRSNSGVRDCLNTCYRVLRASRRLLRTGISVMLYNNNAQLQDDEKEIKRLRDKINYLSEELGRYDRDAVMTPNEQEETFWESLAKVEATTRLINALRRAGINTRKKLLDYDKPFSRIRNCGEATFTELQDVCKLLGWDFKGRW